MMCILSPFLALKKLRVERSPRNQAATSGTADPALSTWVHFESWQLLEYEGKKTKGEMNKIKRNRAQKLQ